MKNSKFPNAMLSRPTFLIFNFVFLISLAGCGTLDKSGVYGGDEFLYQSELTINTGYDVIHNYVTWEKENRALLAAWPEIKTSADVMRTHAPNWFATANAAHDAYKLNPSDENKSALRLTTDVIRTALNEAARYMSRAANK